MPLTALIAEDNLDYRERIVAMLEALSLSCVAAVDGREAIEVVHDLSRELHLLVTDMEMPHHTGWEVIGAARSVRGESLPIIMQTGQTQFSYVVHRARELDIVLLDKIELHTRLVPAVRDILSL
jgi:sigma-B regulation protein RsbU (phosphoserine phosphatase)